MTADRSLIGAPDGRRRLPTPALVLDLDRLDANIAAMAEFARRAGLALRPHGKSHKSVAIRAPADRGGCRRAVLRDDGRGRDVRCRGDRRLAPHLADGDGR